MAQFCTSCGAQIAPGARFCAGCGAMQGAASAAAAPAATPVVAPAKSSPILKIVLIVVGIFALLGIVTIGGIVYTGYRVAKNVKETAREKGVDLDALTSSSPVSGRLPDPCSLVSTSEASEILGVKVISAERSGDKCDYRTETLSAEDQQDKIAKAMKDLENKTDTEKDPSKALEAVTKAMGGAMASGAGGFSIELNRDGKQSLAAMRMALGLAGGKDTMRKVPNLGDDAEMGPLGSMLVFTKGGLGVSIDGRMIAGQEKIITLAQKIASRI